jgi:tricorn protease
LAADTPPPFKDAARAAGFDLEVWGKAPEKKEEAKDAEDEAAPAPAQDPNAPPPGAMRVDTDGLHARHFQLPIEPGTYSSLEAQWGAITYIANKPAGLMDDTWPNPSPPKGTLHRYDLVKEKDKALAEKLNSYAISRDAKTIACPVVDDAAKIASFNVIAATGEGDEPKSIDISSQQLRIDITAEWKQILNEAWRLQRDFYWAPNYAGVNWPAMKAKYEALLPRVGSRVELNDLIGQLIGELGTSHTYIWGGEQHDQIKPINVGMLGADIVFDGQGFRIARIIPGQPWGKAFVSPLEAAHLSVEAGNYITAINGVQIAATSDIFDLLQDQADKLVRLSIADDTRGTNTRTIEVKALNDERPLRYAAWVEANRKYVDEKSGGRLGYLHIPDMGGMGLVMFSRYFYPQFTRQGLVIDIRDNGGGFVSQMIVQRLARKVWAFMEPRHGVRERYPQRTVHGHMAVIIDQHAGSDGDIFPASFKMLGLGPLIGTRTWGGVVGIRGDKPFVDRGLSTQPEFAWWEPKEGWSIENQGVSPDIEVHITPADRVAGLDPQLDRAIDYLLDKLQ